MGARSLLGSASPPPAFSEPNFPFTNISQQVTLFLKLVYSPELMASKSELAPYSALLPRVVQLADELEASRLVAGLCKVSPAQLVQEGNVCWGSCIQMSFGESCFSAGVILLHAADHGMRGCWLFVRFHFHAATLKVHLTRVPPSDAKRCWWYPSPRRWPWMGQSCRSRSWR